MVRLRFALDVIFRIMLCIGAHYPGTTSTPQAVETGKPVWASEDMSTYNNLRGAGCWARILNQNFVNGVSLAV
jgi:galactosylceramidase